MAYSTKPWNSQDVNCPMGAYNCRNDLIYLNRNLHLDGLQLHNMDEIKSVITSCWQRNEPVIANTHRINYVNLQPEKAENGRRVLAALLTWISGQNNVRFLTTGEVGQLYRDGYSIHQIGAAKLVRQWSQPMMKVLLPGSIKSITALPSGREQTFCHDGNDVIVDLKEGDYWVQ